MSTIPRTPQDSRIEIETRFYELFAQLRLNGKPTLIFASHLANWGTSRAGCRRVPPRSVFVPPESITGFGYAADGLKRRAKGVPRLMSYGCRSSHCLPGATRGLL